MAPRLQHCGLIVADLERSRRFYRDALGLEEVSRPPNFVFAGAWLRVGEDQIHLLAASDTTGSVGTGDPGPSVATGLATHVAIEVDDLAAALARLRAHGVELAGGPLARGDGYDQVFLLDPDGYVLELFEHTGADQSEAPPREPIRR